MSTYLYRCTGNACGAETTVRHGMAESPTVECGLHAPPLPMRIVVGGSPAFSIPDRSGYHPGLALRAGDPTAYVSGDRDLRKVIDDRKRRGFEPMKLD